MRKNSVVKPRTVEEAVAQADHWLAEYLRVCKERDHAQEAAKRAEGALELTVRMFRQQIEQEAKAAAFARMRNQSFLIPSKLRIRSLQA